MSDAKHNPELLPCGHHHSLAIISAEEPGKFLYCDLCDARSQRDDALSVERELRAAVLARTKHTHWGIEYLTNSSGRRQGWHLSLHSFRRTKFEAWQAALDYFVSLQGSTPDRWAEWHAMRDAGRIRAVKLSIRKATGEQHV